MSETMNTLLAVGIIAVVVAMMMPKGAFSQLIAFMANRPKPIKMDTKDLFQTFYRQRLRIAKAQRDRTVRVLICSGDQETKAKKFRRIKGMIPDTRCVEFFIRFHFWQWTPSWIICPTDLIPSLLNPSIVICARGLRNQGGVYIPILTAEFSGNEEYYKELIHEYVNNLMVHEQREAVNQQEINKLFDAIAPEPLPLYVQRSIEPTIVGEEDYEEE